MEIIKIKKQISTFVVYVVLCVLVCACDHSNVHSLCTVDVHPSEHILLSMIPGFSLSIAGDSLQKQYPRWNIFSVFSATGILYVDGKAYRFMGGNSYRDKALAPMTSKNCTWKGKYSFLYPGDGWKNLEYDDSQWWNGISAFGSADYSYPINTIWGAFHIYVRRHFHIADKDSLKGRKLYLRYICDDKVQLYLNGDSVARADNFMFWPNSEELSEKIWGKLRNGDNVLAAHGFNLDGQALVDYGLYVENTEYCDVDTAYLKQAKVRTTQTSYLFQCGDVELQLDFTSPSLLHRTDMVGCPVGLISYRIHAGEDHDMRIMFDVDIDKKDVKCWEEKDMSVVKSDSLYLGMKAKGVEYSNHDGHVVFSQVLDNRSENGGVLLVGYEEEQIMQYAGERLLPYWNEDGKKNVGIVLRSIANKYQDLKEECDEIDYQWDKKFLNTANKVYAEKMITNYRTFIATHRFMRTSDGDLLCFNDSLGSVRLAYNSFPILLFFNRIDWLEGLLNPIFGYCENGNNWLKKYPPYDIGKYPIANYQLEDNKNGIESAADMLMMVLALVKAEKNFSYADLHWKLLCQWADYLESSKMEQERLPSDLLDEKDKLRKRELGLRAYEELVVLKENM